MCKFIHKTTEQIEMDQKIADEWERLKHRTAVKQLMYEIGKISAFHPRMVNYEMQLAFRLGFMAGKSKL